MNPTPSVHPSVSEVRSHFPALAQEFAFLENAGGSQMPASVIDSMAAYMRECFVQLGAGYPASDRATATVDEAHRFMTEFVNGSGIGCAVLGPSTSAWMQILANAYADALEPDARIVVAENGHESNVGPWARLERRGFKVDWWRPNPETGEGTLEGLESLLGPKTRIVALAHVSNLLGGIVDLGPVVERAHRVGARVVVDGVAFAPHRAVDVRAWGVDWYCFSNYKVFGPHMATLFGTHEAMDGVDGPNHFFVPRGRTGAKLELGGVNHEGCAALLGLRPYLNFLAGRSGPLPVDHEVVRRAFESAESLETPLQRRLLEYLAAKESVRIVGPRDSGPARVATISFVHSAKSSRSIAQAVNAEGIGIRHGHMYSLRLCRALGLDDDDGVVRVSLVHYNSPEEIERLIAVLDSVL